MSDNTVILLVLIVALADAILGMLNQKDNLVYNHQDSADETMRRLGKLTPQLILRINKS